MILFVNFAGAALGTILLASYGRRTLMIASSTLCVLGMFGMWLSTTLLVESTWLLYLLTIAFIVGFEIGLGPIVWLYLSEICNDKATSVNTVVSWALNLLVSLTTPLLAEVLDNGSLWFLYGCTCMGGLIYICVFMKETKGLSEGQIKALYASNPLLQKQLAGD